jgi:hypothetical protein
MINRRIQGRVLRLGDNTQHRIHRPAWTGGTSTGMFNSCNHRHSRGLERNFFIESEGQYKKDVPHCRKLQKGGGK